VKKKLKELMQSDISFQIFQPARTLSVFPQLGWETDGIPTFDCDICIADYDDEGLPNGEKIGTVSYSIFDWEVISEAGLDIFTAFDLDGELLPFGEALFDFETGELKAEIEEKFENILNLNLLCLNRLVIFPEWRGKGLGLAVNRRLILEYSSLVGLVALKACPLQFCGGLMTEEDKRVYDFKGSKVACTRKLKKYYAHLGFVDTKQDDIMVFDTTRILPLGNQK